MPLPTIPTPQEEPTTDVEEVSVEEASVEEAKPKRKRRTKEEIEAAKATEAPTTSDPTPAAPIQAAPNPFAGSAVPAPNLFAGAQGAPPPFPSAAPAGAAPFAIPGGIPMPDANQLNPFGAPAAELTDDFVIDLSDVQSGGRDFIGNGDHTMYCTAVKTGKSQAGNDKLIFEFTVIAGDYTGKKANLDCAITPNAMWKIDQTLVALGVTRRDAEPTARKPTIGEIKTKAHHVIVIGTFVPDTYNGQPTSKFNTVRPPDELGIKTGTTLEDAQRGAA